MLVVDQLAPGDPLAAIELNDFERARDPSTSRVLADVDLRALLRRQRPHPQALGGRLRDPRAGGLPRPGGVCRRREGTGQRAGPHALDVPLRLVRPEQADHLVLGRAQGPGQPRVELLAPLALERREGPLRDGIPSEWSSVAKARLLSGEDGAAVDGPVETKNRIPAARSCAASLRTMPTGSCASSVRWSACLNGPSSSGTK